MRKAISLFLLISILLISLSSCHTKNASAPTCDEVIAAYKAAGYNVSHHENNYKDESTDEICYIQIWQDDIYESAYFYFYESAEIAKDAKLEYNIVIYMFSIIYGDPTWVWTKTYGNIEYEYEDPRMIKPFNDLIR